MNNLHIKPVQKDEPRDNWAAIPARFPSQPLYQFSQGSTIPQASQQRQPNKSELWDSNQPISPNFIPKSPNLNPNLMPIGGAINATNDGNFAYLGEEYRPTGFTNHFLEARDQRHFFDKVYKDFDLYEKGPTGNMNTERDLLKGFQEAEPVSIMFFGERNVEHLKKLICHMVTKQSNGLYHISPESQSRSDLLIIMRSIYLSNAKQLPDNIPGQVGELNYAVALDLVPRVLKNIQQQLSYIRDHSSQPLTMERPALLSSAGTRSQRNPSVSRTFV